MYERLFTSQIATLQQRLTVLEAQVVSAPSQSEAVTVDAARATTLFRVFQEALSNVAHHAAARQVTVHVVQHADAILLEATDEAGALAHNACQTTLWGSWACVNECGSGMVR